MEKVLTISIAAYNAEQLVTSTEGKHEIYE